MAKLGGIYLSVRAKTDKYKRDLAKANTVTKKAAILMQHHVSNINFKQVGIAALAFSATVAFGIKKAVDAASNLEETVGKFDVVFADHAQQAESMAERLVDSYAMSTREAKQYMSSIQDLLVPMGMASEKAILMSNEVVKLSADLASFNNQTTAQVMVDIQSALVGNFETMKKYGVVLNETVIKQEALNQGLWNGKGMVDANTKAQIAYSLILRGSAAAIGDQQRTMGSYANQIKQLKANYEDLTAMIGNELLPEITAVVQQINDWVKNNDELIKQNIPEYIDNIKTSFGLLSDVLEPVAWSLGVIFDRLKAWKAFSEGKVGYLDVMVSTPTQLKKMVEILDANEKIKEVVQKSIKTASGYHSVYLGKTPSKASAIGGNGGNKPDEEKLAEKLAKSGTIDISGLFEQIGKSDLERDNDFFSKLEEEYDERLRIIEEFNQQYAELGMSQFDIEREQLERRKELWIEAGVEKERIEKMVSAKSIQIATAEQNAKLSIYQNIAGGISETFQMIAQAGGEQSKAAFLAYKAFAMVEAAIAGHKAYNLALSDATVPSTFMRQVNAGIALASALGQVAMIANAQTPSYDSGGVSNARGVYQTGDIREAHVPIPSGKIPVEIKGGGEEKSQEIVIMNTVDPSVMDQYMSSSRGQNAILNVIGNNPQAIRRMSR